MNYIILFLLVLSPFVPAYGAAPECFKNIERSFFDSNHVLEALSLHGVLRGQWLPITDDLQARQTEFSKMVEQRASTMSPNPLDSPFDTPRAAAVLMEVLYEVFSQVLHEHYVYNESDIREMFYFIRSKHIVQLKACFGDNVPKDWYKERD